jgi:hypothetical protein
VGEAKVRRLLEDFPHCLGGFALDAVLAFDLNSPLIRHEEESEDEDD